MMKSFRDYLNMIDSVETLNEEHSTFSDDQLGPMTGMKRYDGLDNSNPYRMWRFMVAAAGHPGDSDMSIEGPTGSKMVSLAYSQADQDILDATAARFGENGTVISDMASTEPSSTNTVSPVRGFKGYAR